MRTNRTASGGRSHFIVLAAMVAATVPLPAAAGAERPRLKKTDRALAARDALAQRLYPARPKQKQPSDERTATTVEVRQPGSAVVEWLARWGHVESQEIR